VPDDSKVKVLLRSPVFHCAVSVVICLVAYSNSFHVPFQLDDSSNILEKFYVRDIRSFFIPSGERPFVYDGAFRTRKIGYLTFALNYWFDGDRVSGYHAVNVLIHCMNALLVYWLVALSFRTPVLGNTPLRKSTGMIALFSALLFASHPVQTQAVTYVVQRFTSLATLFYLLSLTTYIKSRLLLTSGMSRPRALPWYSCSLLSAILAMYTKEIAFTLPLIIVLYEFMFFKGEARKRIPLVVPLLLTMAIIPLGLLGIPDGFAEFLGGVKFVTRAESPLSRLEYFVTELRVIVTYLRLLVFPINQNLDYDYPVYRSMIDGEIILSFTFLAVLAGLGAYLAHRDRGSPSGTTIISFGIFLFFIALSVESSIIPITEVVNEHRLYLASGGAFIALTSSFFLMAQKTRNDFVGRSGVLILAVVVLVFSGLTYERNKVWRSGVTLWEDVVQKSPGKARGHSNLGLELRAKGKVREAIEHYKMAIRLKPGYADAYNNLGVAYKELGLVEDAVEQYKTAIRLQPGFAEAYNNLGIVYWEKGMTRKAISLDLGLANAYTNLGVVYWKLGLTNQAIEQYRIAIELRPDIADPYNNLGVIYSGLGLPDKAMENFELAVIKNPDRLDFRQNRDKAYAIRFKR